MTFDPSIITMFHKNKMPVMMERTDWYPCTPIIPSLCVPGRRTIFEGRSHSLTLTGRNCHRNPFLFFRICSRMFCSDSVYGGYAMPYSVMIPVISS